jgi:hypothetical protein
MLETTLLVQTERLDFDDHGANPEPKRLKWQLRSAHSRRETNIVVNYFHFHLYEDIAYFPATSWHDDR